MAAAGVAVLFAFDNPPPEYAAVAADSLLLCAELGRGVDAVAASDSYHEIVRRFGPDQSPEVQQVVKAAQDRLAEAANKPRTPDFCREAEAVVAWGAGTKALPD